MTSYNMFDQFEKFTPRTHALIQYAPHLLGNDTKEKTEDTRSLFFA